MRFRWNEQLMEGRFMLCNNVNKPEVVQIVYCCVFNDWYGLYFRTLSGACSNVVIVYRRGKLSLILILRTRLCILLNNWRHFCSMQRMNTMPNLTLPSHETRMCTEHESLLLRNGFLMWSTFSGNIWFAQRWWRMLKAYKCGQNNTQMKRSHNMLTDSIKALY